MDNVTHALIGYALAKATPAAWRASPKQLSALILTAVVGSNLPDLDFVIAYVETERKLGSLLHHRGYTHTLAFLPVAALLAAFLGAKGARHAPDRAEWCRLAVLGAVSCALHVAFDGLNNYGVHPFYPFEDSWHYGDSVFIIEPWLFFALLPHALLASRRFASRMTAVGVALVVLAAFWKIPPVKEAAAFGTLLFAGLLALEWRLHRRRGDAPAYAPMATAALVVAVCALSAHTAAGRVRRDARVLVGMERILDVVTSPNPGNPLCWSTLSIGRTADDVLVTRSGTLSLWPSVMSPRRCRFSTLDGSAEYVALPSGEESGLLLHAEYRVPLPEARALASRSCRARAAFQFLRAPFLRKWEGATFLLGDLRFDRSPRPDFSDVIVEETGEGDGKCPRWSAPWVPPRQDALGR